MQTQKGSSHYSSQFSSLLHLGCSFCHRTDIRQLPETVLFGKVKKSKKGCIAKRQAVSGRRAATLVIVILKTNEGQQVTDDKEFVLWDNLLPPFEIHCRSGRRG